LFHKQTLPRRAVTLTLLALIVLPAIGSAQQSSMSERMRAMWPEFTNWPPKVGETAIDFTLKTLDGETFTLSEHYRDTPVVIEFGSFT